MPGKTAPESFALWSDRPAGMLSLENNLRRHGYRVIAGVDEAGRGPLAGPVVAAAVVLGEGFDIAGIDDSKRLSESRRQELFKRICRHASGCAVALVDQERIDAINILAATKQAMCLALSRLPVTADFVLIDGNQKIPIRERQRAVVGGDGKSASIAAASIVAKVTRDLVMTAYHECWPAYNFLCNKGYPTREHRGAVKRHGPCPIHRRSFSGVRERL